VIKIVALQEYVLLVAQAPGGGLRDKPGKPADAYHTSCNLSGLSSAQSKMSFSHSTLALLSTAFVSPFMTPKIIEVEEDNDEETEMIQDDYETDVQAEERMKIVWSRTLGWRVEGELLLVGGEENELVSLS
jgi:protein farnesyltransferase subunit beta